MPEILQLDPHVANLIAAGEVVERPASVVKELTENAIDAGATAITIEIKNGGMSLIRVTDNGCGIPWDQCERAFLRHATSKLRNPEDLAAIGTLGFRGEALAAIASVARIELFTRTAGEELGTSLTLEGGAVLEKESAGCPLGTTMVVRNLFYNTPARLKFMKRDAAEGAAVAAAVHRLALSHPEISLKFIRDGKQELHTPGDGELKSALYAVFGRDLALGFTPVQGEGETVSVSGFVSLPVCCRGSRTYQVFFVNGRHVKSKLLTSALERAYENQKMVGKFPGCVLQVTVKPSAVDVNVHPAKTEVKFLHERAVFDAVYYTVLSALDGNRSHPTVTFAPPEPMPVPPAPPVPHTVPTPSPTVSFRSPSSADLLRPIEIRGKTVCKNVDKPVENVENTKIRSEEGEKLPLPERPVSTKKPHTSPEPVLLPEPECPPWRLAGEVLNTYVIAEQEDTVYLIDKHAAHERMQFDRMKQEGYRPMAQTLLTPLVFHPDPAEGAVLLEHKALLEEFGFSCEDFGGGDLALRTVPSTIEPGEAPAALSEIAEQLLAGERLDADGVLDAVMHTMACKAAVKGGQVNSREELRVVAEAVLSGKVQYCPHGRPVAITMTKKQLEKQFKRS